MDKQEKIFGTSVQGKGRDPLCQHNSSAVKLLSSLKVLISDCKQKKILVNWCDV